MIDDEMNETGPERIQLDREIDGQVDALARVLDRPKAWIIEQAVKDFLALHAWQLEAIDEGVREADSGRVVAHEDVAAWVRSWGQPGELPLPKCE